MDEEKQLRLREEVILHELAFVRAKLELIRLTKSENQKDNSVPSSETPMKTESSLGSPAPSKDTPNPVKVVNLPKIQTEVQTSQTLVKPSDLNLRPNEGIRIPIKSDLSSVLEKSKGKGIQIPSTNSKYYYVVFNGPNAGIYESWNIAEKATIGVSGIKHKRFNSFMEARTQANLYCLEKMTAPLDFITSAATLKPNSYALAMSQGKQTKVSLGKLPVKVQSPIDDGKQPDLRVSDFMYLYSLARRATEQTFVDEHFFTNDKTNISYYNFCKNADPQQVAETWASGLVQTIYPSKNLLEIKMLPQPVRKAIKAFRTKVLKDSDKDIFIKVQSTLPAWQDGVQVYSPHHLIQIGVSKGENYLPSKIMKEKLEETDLPALREKSIEKYLTRILSFHAEEKIFVNYHDDKILIFSSSYKPIGEESERSILSFQRKICTNGALGPHTSTICKIMEDKATKAGIHYECRQCKAKGNSEADAPGSSSTSSIM